MTYLMTCFQSIKCLLMTLHAIPSLSDLNYDLETINQSAHQWQMSFDPDPYKQATKMLFSRKVNLMIILN